MEQIYNWILLSYKSNTFESVLMRWIDLKPIIQSEVNQKEKSKYHILHICMESPWNKSYDKPRLHIKKQRRYFVNKGPSIKAIIFLVVMYVWMWELDCKESWALKNWCFWTVVLEKTLESPLDCKEIQPVHSKGDQPWVFFGRNDAKAENANILATWYEEQTHWKGPWCWEGFRAVGEGDNRGWDDWMASRTQWTWV